MADKDPYHAAHEDNRIHEHLRVRLLKAQQDLVHIRLVNADREPTRRTDDTGFAPGCTI